MFDPKTFTTTSPKPLPVVLLLDVSGSMAGDKIDSLNAAVETMLETFSQEEKMEVEILVSVITFGSEVSLHTPYTKASRIQWHPLEVSGLTPMGTAINMAKAMIEDKETTPSRAYRPTIVLVSDGDPIGGDDWEQAIHQFVDEGRSAKCDRMAMAIGREANKSVLERFINGTNHDLFYAQDANQLHEFFQMVTMSVTMRSRSKNPNLLPAPAENKQEAGGVENKPSELDDDEGYW